ncbi:MAG: hypothetical protein OZ935_05145 [Pseudomonadota bacterium]|nr:hypothetical protein [Pseudomonadota bacterium]
MRETGIARAAAAGIRAAIEFYKYDRDWANRFVAGKSLLAMSNLLQKESMAGHVQIIHIESLKVIALP